MPILLDKKLPKSLNDTFEVIEIDFKNFQPGFDFIKIEGIKKIVGLKQNSAAYESGIRNGMTYLKSTKSTRGPSCSENWQMKVIVIDKRVQKHFEFIPNGKPIKIQQIQKNKIQ